MLYLLYLFRHVSRIRNHLHVVELRKPIGWHHDSDPNINGEHRKSHSASRPLDTKRGSHASQSKPPASHTNPSTLSLQFFFPTFTPIPSVLKFNSVRLFTLFQESWTKVGHNVFRSPENLHSTGFQIWPLPMLFLNSLWKNICKDFCSCKSQRNAKFDILHRVPDVSPLRNVKFRMLLTFTAAKVFVNIFSEKYYFTNCLKITLAEAKFWPLCCADWNQLWLVRTLELWLPTNSNQSQSGLTVNLFVHLTDPLVSSWNSCAKQPNKYIGNTDQQPSTGENVWSTLWEQESSWQTTSQLGWAMYSDHACGQTGLGTHRPSLQYMCPPRLIQGPHVVHLKDRCLSTHEEYS